MTLCDADRERTRRYAQLIIRIINTTNPATSTIGTIAAFQSLASAFGAFAAARFAPGPKKNRTASTSTPARIASLSSTRNQASKRATKTD